MFLGSCNETHRHRPVEGTFPPAASPFSLVSPIDVIVLQRPAPVELAELVAGATIKRRLRSKQTIQRRLTKKQPSSGKQFASIIRSSNRDSPRRGRASDCARQNRTVKVGRASGCAGDDGNHGVPLTENGRIAWSALSPEEKEVCDALVHRLHRELGHSDIRGMVDSLCQNRAHSTVLAAAKLMHFTACQESARMLSRPCDQWKGHGTWSGPADGQFLLETSLEGGACQRHIVSGCLFKGGCDSDLVNCTSSGTSWKRVSIGSKTNASGIVVQVLRTSRDSHHRP